MNTELWGGGFARFLRSLIGLLGLFLRCSLDAAIYCRSRVPCMQRLRDSALLYLIQKRKTTEKGQISEVGLNLVLGSSTRMTRHSYKANRERSLIYAPFLLLAGAAVLTHKV